MKRKILIIEDEKDLRETLADVLEISGYEVVISPDGFAGIEAIIDSKPDLVLCDVNMPKMNGFEVLTAIKEKLNDDSMPIFIYLSARIQSEDIEHGLNLGADDFVTKPFDVTELLETLAGKLNQ